MSWLSVFTSPKARRLVHWALLLALLVGLAPSAAASAQAPVTIYQGSATVQDEFWNMALFANCSGQQQIDCVLKVGYLDYLYGQNPNLPPATAQEKLAGLMDAWQNQRKGLPDGWDTGQQTLLYMQTALDAFAQVAPGAQGTTANLIKGVLGRFDRSGLDLGVGSTSTGRLVNGLQNTYYTGIELWSDDQAKQILALTHALGNQSPLAKTAIDAAMEPDIKAFLDEDPLSVINRNQVLANAPGMAEIQAMIVSGDGAIRTDLTELTVLFSIFKTETNAKFAEQRALLQQIVDLDRQDLPPAQKREQMDAKAQEAKEKAEEIKKYNEGAQSLVYIVSTLAGMSDPKAGKEIAAVGGALVQIGTGVAQIAVGISTVNPMTIITGVAGILRGLTGAINGVQDPPPTIEQQILSGLHSVSQQIADLRTLVNQRFDRIERGLNQIMGALAAVSGQLDQIGWRLDRQEVQLEVIQSQLVQASLQLDQLHAQLLTYVQTLGQRDLKSVMDAALGYKERTGQDMLYEQFIESESSLFLWATEHDRDDLEAPTAGRSVADLDLYRELSLDSNLNYLDLVLTGNPTLFGGVTRFIEPPQRLPNLSTWMVASTAYAQLMSEWPQLAIRISSRRREQVAAMGAYVKRALRRMAVLDTQQGPQPNFLLFDRLVDNYATKFQALNGALAIAESNHITEVLNIKPYSHDIDLFGDPQQDVAPKTLASGASVYCDGRAIGAFPSPQAITRLAPQAYRMADALGMQPAGDLCVVSSTEPPEGNPPALPIDPPPPCVLPTWDWTIVLGLRYNGQVFARTSASTTVRGLNRSRTDCYYDMDAARDRLVAQLGSTPALPPTPAETAVATQLVADYTPMIQSAFTTTLQYIYGSLAADFDKSSSSVNDAAVALAGAKLLLVDFVRLALPVGLGKDAELDELLAGPNSLPDRDLARAAFQAAAAAPVTGQNARLTLKAETETKIDRVRDLLHLHLTEAADGELKRQNPETAPDDATIEGQALVELTVLRLNIATHLLPPPLRPQLYIPFAHR